MRPTKVTINVELSDILDLQLQMSVVAVWGGTMIKLHVSLCKLNAKTGINIFFGMHFIQLKLQISSLGGDHTVLNLPQMRIQLIFVA
ncbi:hypothetical protein ACSBR1_015742 [Camellia fascicularis]